MWAQYQMQQFPVQQFPGQMAAPAIHPGVDTVMATPMGQTIVQPMETPLNTNWQCAQYLPTATSTPQDFTREQRKKRR
eukprot:11145448-Prorocentrum_lima.AAC.1